MKHHWEIDEITSANIHYTIQSGRKSRPGYQTSRRRRKKKKKPVVCLRPKWLICNTISKIFMWSPDECLLSMRPCVLVTSSFTVWGFCNFSVELTRPKMCSPGPPGPWAAQCRPHQKTEVARRALLALKSRFKGGRDRVWILKPGLAHVLDVDILLRTSVLTAARAGSRALVCLPVQCLPYFI